MLFLCSLLERLRRVQVLSSTTSATTKMNSSEQQHTAGNGVHHFAVQQFRHWFHRGDRVGFVQSHAKHPTNVAAIDCLMKTQLLGPIGWVKVVHIHKRATEVDHYEAIPMSALFRDLVLFFEFPW